ncbi:MAG: hypothetical protein CMC97_07145 [Flavobacteriales bacterium]|nr:hypothetical protein [Flavobacteriales bacterium]
MKGKLLLIAILMGAMGSSHGQSSGVGVGTDGALWAAGWTNLHIGLAVHEEVRVHIGFGVMGDSEQTSGLAIRQRPEDFDQATLLTLGVRAYPEGIQRPKLKTLLGLEYAEETFRTQLFPGTSAVGRMDWVRTDARVLAGIEWRPVQRMGVNLHVGVGRSAVRGTSLASEFVPRHGEHSPFTRLLGTELLFWF